MSDEEIRKLQRAIQEGDRRARLQLQAYLERIGRVTTTHIGPRHCMRPQHPWGCHAWSPAPRDYVMCVCSCQGCLAALGAKHCYNRASKKHGYCSMMRGSEKCTCDCPCCSRTRIQKLAGLRFNPDVGLREAERRFQEDPTLANRYYVNRLRIQHGLEPILDQWYVDTLVEELRKLLLIHTNLSDNGCRGTYFGFVVSIFPHQMMYRIFVGRKLCQTQELRIHVASARSDRPAVYLDISINTDELEPKIQEVKLVHYNPPKGMSGKISLLEEWLYNPQELLEFLINELRLFSSDRNF